MARTIWKFLLQPVERQVIYLPAGAAILTVAAQAGEICLWALVDPQADQRRRDFLTAGTGHRLPDSLGPYLGTAHLCGGSLVLHVFDMGEG